MRPREDILSLGIWTSVTLAMAQYACPDDHYRTSLSTCFKCRSSCSKCMSWNYCYTCKTGYYGTICEDQCDPNCLGNVCNKAAGSCVHGCVSGYYQFSARCYQCFIHSCRKCRDKNYCTRCAIGYSLTSSNSCRICQVGTWGYQCNRSCSQNCVDTKCSNKDGYCVSCPKYSYGHRCQYQCSDGCKDDSNNSVCNRETGTCMYGCKAGYSGKSCDSVDGHWSEWSDNGPCSASCGNGTRTKTRTCDNPAPKKSGKTCFGNNMQFVNCDMASCQDSSVQTGDHSDYGGAVIGGVAGGVALLVIVGIVLAIFFILRRQRRGEKNSGCRQVVYANNPPATVTDDGFENTSHNADQGDSRVEIEVYRNTLREGHVYSVPQKENTIRSSEKKKSRGIGSNASQNEINIPPVPLKFPQYMDDNDLEEINESNISEMDISDGNIKEQSEAYYNMAGLIRRRIPVEKLAKTVAEMSAVDFLEEFERLTDGLSRDYRAAVIPENMYRNRYKMIFPYDASRVKLTGESSDYINASYIDAYQQSKTYIACLGPTETTTDKFVLFWTMIWQQNVEKIVMLTGLMEDKKMKCEQYWPDTDCKSYGSITVYPISEINYAEFSIRNFDVMKGSEIRSVCQIHYLAWPDMGVPDDVTSLLEFRHKVIGIPTCLDGPTAVHCSAGIGRTGTYIALDMLIQEGSEEKYVDIFDCVNGIRGQRVNLVQNVGQYKFLHYALVHELTLPSQMVSPEYLAWFLTEEGRNELRWQFQQLHAVIRGTTHMDNESVRRNMDLNTNNRKETDVPGGRHRVKLNSRKRGGSDYINATFINGYIKKNQFIIAQTPLPKTLEDFFELIMQENITCIVSMDPEITQDKTVGVYLPPANQTFEVDIYNISCSQSECFANYVMRIIEVSKHQVRGIKTKKVYHFQQTLWKANDLLPNDAADFVHMISLVEETAVTTGKNSGRILIHCLNAAERSGLFCGVALLIQKLRQEQNISVINTVRYLKSIRPLAIPDEEQYIFCFECAVAYQTSTDTTYTNLARRT